MLRPDGATGVQTHVREVMAYFAARGNAPRLVTPLSWGGPLSVPVFAPRLLIDRVSGAASVVWYRFWHFRFLRRALRRQLRTGDDAIIYAQCPLAARAALEARRDRRQRVVIAIHFEGSQADEWVDAGKIQRGGAVYRGIRRTERRIVPTVDRILYVSAASKFELERRIEAAIAVPAAVIPNFISDRAGPRRLSGSDVEADLVNVGGLLLIKNHRFLLEVLAHTNRLGRHYTLDIVGDGPLAHSLASQARSLGVQDQVRFLGRRDDVQQFVAPASRVRACLDSREPVHRHHRGHVGGSARGGVANAGDHGALPTRRGRFVVGPARAGGRRPHTGRAPRRRQPVGGDVHGGTGPFRHCVRQRRGGPGAGAVLVR